VVGVVVLVAAVAVVIALLGGAAIVAVNRGKPIEESQTERAKGDIQTLSIALDAYSYGAGRYPTTEQGIAVLVDKPTREPVPDRWHRYLKELPTDAWKRPYKYRYPAQRSKEPFDIWSVGRDGIDGTADDMGNWSNEAKSETGK
jgi:general secretion pathway protein G